MIACVSPDLTVRSTPRRISLAPSSVSTETVRPLISSVCWGIGSVLLAGGAGGGGGGGGVVAAECADRARRAGDAAAGRGLAGRLLDGSGIRRGGELRLDGSRDLVTQVGERDLT